MKNTFFLVFCGIFLVVGVLGYNTQPVQATVGGPTYISELAYSESENTVYYVVNDNNGRGCPPIVHKLDLATLVDVEVKTCDQIEAEYYGSNDPDALTKYDGFVSDIYKNLHFIGSVSLKKNQIHVAVAFVNEHIEYGDKFWSEFKATIAQDGKVLAEIPFRGCDKEQPHIFEGYRVPNTDLMLVVSSTKGDCFEGGYVVEKLHVVKGVTYADTTIVRSFKNAEATEPNLANVVVVAGKAPNVESTDAPTTNTDAGDRPSMDLSLSVLGVVLVAGLLGGYFLGKKSS